MSSLCLLFLLALTLGHVESREGVMSKKELTAEVKDIKAKLANLTSCNCDSQSSEAQATRDELAKLTTDFQTFKGELSAVKSNSDDIAKVKTDVVTINGELAAIKQTAEKNSRSVGFFAKQVNPPSPLRAGAKLVLDSITNVGGAYDNQTGVFTAPYTGTYLFYAIIGIADNSVVKTYMIAIIRGSMDVPVIATCAASYGTHFETAVCQSVVRVVAGQMVWLQNLLDFSQYRQYYTTFGGHLIQAEM